MRAGEPTVEIVDHRSSGLHFPAALWLAAAAVIALWVELIIQLHLDWSYNPSYGYGWSVPFLAAYVFVRRWSSRPEPRPFASSRWPTLLIIIFAAMLLPLRIAAKANPDWRLVSWSMAISITIITFSVLARTGGQPWVRHFAFPVLFLLVSVPWPAQLEQIAVQQLMRIVAAIDVEVLNFFGVASLQHGNVIELPTGMVGLEDACSGIRSLQASFMISLFLGELYSLGAARRFILIFAGGLFAIFFNLVRTFLLAWIGAHRGIDSISQWHDPAGLWILLACLFSVWGMSLWMTPGRREAKAPTIAARAHYPAKIFVALFVWLALVEIGSETWFRAHAGGVVVAPPWEVIWPQTGNQFQEVQIPDAAATLLRFNEGRAIAWDNDTGKHWNLFFFKWLPGRTAALFIKVHRPEICLPASGRIALSGPTPQLIRVGGTSLSVRAYRFDDNGVPLHIFYSYWDGTVTENAQQATEEDWTVRGRLRRAWLAQRDRGTQVVEIAAWGYNDDAIARDELTRQLTRFVKS